MDRRTKLALNTSTSLALQVVNFACGFILPRLILGAFGSQVNGLVNSIAQFLTLISFLELGVGAVIESSLYKPLADGDNAAISAVITSGKRFFGKVFAILAVYFSVLVMVYPFLVKKQFDWPFTAMLVFALGMSSFSQYYFGIVDSLLLAADQRGYVQYSSQMVTLVLNTAASYVLIRLGFGIQVVKLVSALIFFMRPLALRLYVNRHYRIDRHCKYDREPIAQKWNGIAQHIAAVVISDTDVIVLTVLSTLENVSVYTVYNMIAAGVKSLLISATNGVQSLMGEMLARKEDEKLHQLFGMTEFIVHSAVVFLFMCTAILIVPFVSVYTNGISDVNYIQPMFAILLTAAHASHCLRLPYNIAILAAGHYKQTQSNFIVSAAINVVVSISTVYRWGLVGVAAGTLAAMLYQTVWMAIYDSRNIINWPIRNFVKQCLVDVLNAGVIIAATRRISLAETTYLSWVVMALKVAGISFLVIGTTSVVFFRDRFRKIADWIVGKMGK